MAFNKVEPCLNDPGIYPADFFVFTYMCSSQITLNSTINLVPILICKEY